MRESPCVTDRSFTIDTRDGTIAAWRGQGTAGPVAVLLHGGPGMSATYLDPLTDLLADVFSTVSYQQRGLPPTTIRDPYTVEANVADAVAVIDQVAALLHTHARADIATLAARIDQVADMTDPNNVKVACDAGGRALYFSRAPIPWVRDTASKIVVRHMKHLGLYVFQRDALLEYPTLPQGELERIEQLEQLRWMENGWKIRVAEVEHDAVSVDVQEDVARVEKLLQK